MMLQLALVLAAILDDPAAVARPDLETMAVTIEIALEDAPACEQELRLGEINGRRCDVFLLAWREVVRDGVAVERWRADGRPGALAGDAAVLDALRADRSRLDAAGSRILQRVDILRGDKMATKTA